MSDQGRNTFVLELEPGNPADKLAAALEPFGRLSKARESEQGGFGLGLAIVQAIAKGHDGELVLRANEPIGLVATIRLPVRALLNAGQPRDILASPRLQ
jgi:signal transduction histidine kinase